MNFMNKSYVLKLKFPFFFLLLLFKFKLHETKLVALGMEGLFLALRSIIFDTAHRE